ncbi:hypothetical protein [Saccharothrix lopnurensis]|uniref:Uncharacterized protein n=1 Tax=Saccharothrix lopnurensis TaxID=1670621 RepID=A0ABW1P5A2_9PSEU
MADAKNTTATDRTVLIRAADLTDLTDALDHYRGRTAVDAVTSLASASDNTIVWAHLWYGLNHQHLRAGDPARCGDADDLTPCIVLATGRYGALVQHAGGTDWFSWDGVHHPDRLHIEPTFDAQDLAAIEHRMGRSHTPDTWPTGVDGAAGHGE